VDDPAAHSPTRSWFSASDAATSEKDDRLISPPLDLTAGSRLRFWHRHHFEAGFDGGVLEIHDGTAWTDLGPWMVSGGYGADTVAVGGVERRAWSGTSGPAMSLVEVDLGAFAGAGRRLRWRLVADFVTAEETVGWHVDDVEVTALASGPGRCNLPPAAVDDDAATTVGTAVEVAPLLNDADPNGDPLALGALGAPAHGTAEARPDGTVLYTPAAGFVGGDAFAYEASDGELVGVATVRIAVTDPSGGASRARGNGEVAADGGGTGRFAFHARRDDAGGSGWLRWTSAGSAAAAGAGAAIEVEGSVRTVRFLAPGRAELEGVGFLADGAPCSFSATVEDAASDHFAIEVRDAVGTVLSRGDGVPSRGGVRID
jgi:hypothetical protein